MLKACPECGLQVSDKANVCPHCGYPLRSSVQSRKPNTTYKHRRLPNGFGQITEIKGKYLRKPYRAMVTIGKTSTGRPICRILKPEGYFRTYNEAYNALMEYNKNPYDLEADLLVFELYDRWSKEYFRTLKSPSSVRTVEAAWNYCSSIKDYRVKDLRARHIKQVMDQGEYNGHTASPGVKSRIKSLFNIMLDYAVEYEIVDRNYARTFDVSDDIIDEITSTKRDHISFSESEMDSLWKYNTVPFVDFVLVQCYMGWRPQELGLLRIDDVNIIDWTITGGMKTDAGENRTVPIHPAIRDQVKKNYELNIMRGSEYLFTDENGKKLTYDKYSKRFEKVIKELGLNPDHRPHDPRKQFVTMCKKYNVDEYAIKRMVGHKVSDITEAVYTDRDLNWLHEEVKKIKGPAL